MSVLRFASAGGLSTIVLLSVSCASLDDAAELGHAASETTLRVGTAPAGWSGSVAAIEKWNATRLTLAAAVDLALRNDPAVVAGRPRIAAARARYADAATPPNPVVRWMVGAPIDPFEAVPFLIGVSQDLALLLERDVMEEVARHRLDAEVLEVANAVVGTVFEVRLAHARVASEQDRAIVHRALADLAELRLKEIEDRLEVGEASPSERDETAAAAHAARASLAESERSLAAAKLELLHAMGSPERRLDFEVRAAPGDDVQDVLSMLEASGPSEHATPDLRLSEIALARRLDLLASDLEARARLVEIGLAERSVWRGLSFGVGVDRDMEGMRGVPFSGTIPLPIFDDGRIADAAAVAAWRLALLERVELAQRIEFEVRSAWNDLVARSEILAQRRIALARLERVESASQDLYEAGLEPLEAVRRYERDRLLAALATIDAAFAAELASLQLRTALGGDLPHPAPAVVAADPRSEGGSS